MLLDDNVQLDTGAIEFLQKIVGDDSAITLVSGDASFRRYFRITTATDRFIFMDAPPEKEDSAPFVDISRFLLQHGVSVPRVVAVSLQHGHLLLDDFGDQTFLAALKAGSSSQELYQEAVAVLLKIQESPVDGSCVAHGRPYDQQLLAREFALFTDWYVEGICKKSISAADRKLFSDVFARMMDHLLAIPAILVHRDYHCRNLMWQPEKSGQSRVGVLDFQDAVMGPITYDLASLLRDCYVAWDGDFRQMVCKQWLQGASDRLGYAPNSKEFKKDFDWMALQRNLKAIGIFGRLSLRDGKHGYLEDIPRTFSYLHETLPDYPELADLALLINRYTQ